MKKYVKSSDQTITTKTQAKEIAKHIIEHQLDNVGYWEESYMYNEGYSQIEIDMINEEIRKLIIRIDKLLGL